MFTSNELFNFGQNFQANIFGFTSQVHIVLVLFSLSLPRVVSGDTPYLIYYCSFLLIYVHWFVRHMRWIKLSRVMMMIMIMMMIIIIIMTNLKCVNPPGVTDNIEFPSQSTGNIVSISAPTTSVQDLTICMWVRTQVEVNHPVGLISCLSGNNIEMEIRYDNDGPRTLELQVGNAVT